MEYENIALICECGSSEHLLIIRTDIEDVDHFYIETHLSKESFWYRLKYAVKYLFGYQCKYGAFEEVIISKARLYSVLKDFNERANDG